MTVLRALLALAAALFLEAGLGRWAAGVRPFVDAMMVVVAWYGIARSRRAAMIVGCIAGLLQDSWFLAGAFGINGFRKTLLGWTLGGLGSTFDLNHFGGRLVVGAALPIADGFLEFGLMRLFQLSLAPLDPVVLSVRAAIGGLLTALIFAILDRVRGKEAVQRRVR